jgi:nucleoside-diphosphate-sugar epimerase
MLPGQIYGNGGMFKKYMLSWACQGKLKIIGNGGNRIPRVHVEDCASAYVRAVRKLPLGERFIIADDYPCNGQRIYQLYHRQPGPGQVRPYPALPVRILKGNLTLKTVLMDCKVSNNKAKSELGWELKYPTYREGLKEVLGNLKGVSDD